MSTEEIRALAVEVVGAGGSALHGNRRLTVFSPNGVWVFSEAENSQLKAIQNLVGGYLGLAAPSRPLCLGVFGPPGSGKSFGVKRIVAALADDGGPELPLHEINLTQYPSAEALANEMVQRIANSTVDSVPVFFFDEFDAPLAGKTLGWLPWLLAPMHDGVFQYRGTEIRVSRAVFVFAGGTADTLADFEVKSAAFRAAKGPDFVSRLRGFLNVRGPNDPEATDLRRAIMLHGALGKVREARGATSRVRLGKHLCEDLLNVGRFRHGARSLEAIVEMTAARAGTARTLVRKHLPEDHLLTLHVDRGPLDVQAVGGLIGLSGGGADDPFATVWKALAQDLWRRGASLAYGGDQRMGILVGALTELHQDLPRRLARERMAVDEPRLVFFPPELTALGGKREGRALEVVAPPRTGGLSGMRWRMTCRCAARVLVGGRTENYAGRMPGLFEEAAMALLQRQPLYLLGGFGGAAGVLCALLGLAKPDAKALAVGPPTEEALTSARAVPHGTEAMPPDVNAATGWLPGFAIDGPAWPNNGLTVAENRELASATGEERIVELVLRGLERRFR